MMNGASELSMYIADQIAQAKAGSFGGAVLLCRNNQHTRFKGQTVKAHDPPVNRHVLTGDTNVTAANFPVFDQPTSHKFRRVTGDGEADALRRPDHRCVYAYDFTS